MASHSSSFYALGNNKEAVFTACIHALTAMNATVQQADNKQEYIVAGIGMNLLTFGETIEVIIKWDLAAGGFLITVTSSTSQAVAWGKNQKNTETFESQFIYHYGNADVARTVGSNPAPSEQAFGGLNIGLNGPGAYDFDEDEDENEEDWTQPDSNDYYEPYMEPMAQQSAQQNTNAPRIFMSYRRADSADVTGRMYDRLVAEFGKEAIFKDVDSIPFGVNFADYLDQQVQQCDLLLAIIGRDWVDIAYENGQRRLHDPKDFVRIEIESALKRNIPVVPILVRGADMPDANDLPESLRDLLWRNGTQVRPDPDFHNDMNRLIDGIKGQ